MVLCLVHMTSARGELLRGLHASVWTDRGDDSSIVDGLGGVDRPVMPAAMCDRGEAAWSRLCLMTA